MAHHLHIEETTYEIQAPVRAPSLGRLLGETGLATRRLVISMLIRVALVAFAAFLLWSREELDLASTTDQVVLAIYAVFVLFPLVHVRDSIKFYQNGIAYNGKTYIFQTSKVTWSKRTGAGYFLAYEMLQMAGMPKGANVSYIKDAQELFDGFYRKPGSPAAQGRTLLT